MTIVFILSYLAIFMLGGCTSIGVMLYLADRQDKKREIARKQAVEENLETHEAVTPPSTSILTY